MRGLISATCLIEILQGICPNSVVIRSLALNSKVTNLESKAVLAMASKLSFSTLL